MWKDQIQEMSHLDQLMDVVLEVDPQAKQDFFNGRDVVRLG